MRDEEKFRQNIIYATDIAWRELLRHENEFVIKKIEQRDTFSQLLYKMKKLFTDERAPENALKIVRKTDNTRPWYQSSHKHKKVYVRIEVFICPLQGDQRLDAPHIYAQFEDKPVPLARLSVYIQAKHFYDDHAPQECPVFTRQVREKFGPLNNNHITKWRPTQALEKGWLMKFYKASRKIDKWDEILKDFIDLDTSSATWGDNHWYTDVHDGTGA
jgi:hypothetical protein